MSWWVSEWFAINPVFLVSWVIWVVGSITLHELGHGYVAVRCGDDVPIHSGHMTLNPLVHIPGMAWIMFAIFGFTWGLMPVNPSNFRGRYDEAKVAFAGPLVNLSLCVACLLLDVIWLKVGAAIGDPFHKNVHTFLWCGVMINMMGFVFNLIPIPPMDGSRILGDFFPKYNEIWRSERGSVIALVAFAVLFFYGSSKIWALVIFASALLVQIGASAIGADWRNPIRTD